MFGHYYSFLAMAFIIYFKYGCVGWGNGGGGGGSCVVFVGSLKCDKIFKME